MHRDRWFGLASVPRLESRSDAGRSYQGSSTLLISRIHERGRWGVIVSAIGLTISFLSVSAGRSAEPTRHYSATVVRDRYGVPHIRAAKAADAAYALGYSQCVDRYPVVIGNLYAAAGQLAELQGESQLEADKIQRVMRHTRIAQRDWDRLSPELREYLTAFAAGINDWVAQNKRLLTMPVRTFTGVDVMAAHRQILTATGLSLAKAESELGLVEPGQTIPPGKSNAWAVRGAKTVSGKPMVLIDPHWPIEGPLQLYEARIQAGGLDVWGFMLTATPLVGLGATSGVAWTFTAGGADSADAFQLRLHPQDPHQYEWDGKWVPMERHVESIHVLEDGKLGEVPYETFTTIHGPVLTNRKAETFAARLPGWEDAIALEQFWRMNHARTAAEFRDALKLDQLSYFNVVWGSCDNDIGYVQLGRVVRRSAEFDWNRLVPGWTSRSWSTERIPVQELPQVVNPAADFLQNCNVAANVVSPGLTMKPDDFPPGVLFGHYGAYRARGQRATQLLLEASSLDFDKARAIVFDTYSPPADIWIPILEQAYQERPSSELDDAITLLRNWNRHVDSDSTGATLFRFWRLACDSITESAVGRDAFDIQSTAELRSESLQALRIAVADLRNRYGRMDVAWGTVKRLRRGEQEWGLSGDALDRLGLDTLRATAASQLNQDNKLIISGGQSTIGLVTWDTKSPMIRAIVAYGQSISPASPHFADQAPLYARHELRTVPWTMAELESDANRTENISNSKVRP